MSSPMSRAPGYLRSAFDCCKRNTAQRSGSPSPTETTLGKVRHSRLKAVILKVTGALIGFAMHCKFRTSSCSCGMNSLQDWSTHPGELFVMMITVPSCAASCNVSDAALHKLATCSLICGRIIPTPHRAPMRSSHEVGMMVSSQSKAITVSRRSSSGMMPQAGRASSSLALCSSLSERYSDAKPSPFGAPGSSIRRMPAQISARPCRADASVRHS
mmetsp:Transcript_22983/g.66574  ORF Transcript_22983/g.66574 Transcript_22983/m.66574 type:complete len:215 (+) Transcript_22983:1384-2028(+)